MRKDQTTLLEWIRERTRASVRDLGKVAGVSHTTLLRQLNGSIELRPQTLIAIARHYNLDVLSILIKADVITQAEAQRISTEDALRTASDLELAREILRRAEQGTATKTLTRPLHPVPDVGGVDDDAQEEWELRQVADREQIGELGPDEDDGA